MKASASKALLSAFLVWHLTALGLSALPNPADLRATAGTRVDADDAVSRPIRPALDRIATPLMKCSDSVWRATALLRAVTDPYVRRLGLVQDWSMFANPSQGSAYVRFRYYTAPARDDHPTEFLLENELAFPLRDDEAARGAAYLLGRRDKAMSNALRSYFQERSRLMKRDAAATGPARTLYGGAAENFVPVVHFFTDRYAHTRLRTDYRLVRTEVWYGWAATRERDNAPLSPRSRAAVVERYRREAGPMPATVIVPPPVDTLFREADIDWLLIYVEAS